jgi:hypothetical protein
VHVARARRLSREFTVEPPEVLEVQDVHVVGCKWPLTKPTSNDVQVVV